MTSRQAANLLVGLDFRLLFLASDNEEDYQAGQEHGNYQASQSVFEQGGESAQVEGQSVGRAGEGSRGWRGCWRCRDRRRCERGLRRGAAPTGTNVGTSVGVESGVGLALPAWVLAPMASRQVFSRPSVSKP